MEDAQNRNTWVQMASYIKNTLHVDTMEEFLGRKIEIRRLIVAKLEEQNRLDPALISTYLYKLKTIMFPEKEQRVFNFASFKQKQGNPGPKGTRGRKKKSVAVFQNTPHALLASTSTSTSVSVSTLPTMQQEVEHHEHEEDPSKFRVSNYFPEMQPRVLSVPSPLPSLQQQQEPTPPVRIDAMAMMNTSGRLPTDTTASEHSYRC